jgi:hypothetical protein
MLRKLSRCLIGFALVSGVGCKQRAEDSRPEALAGVGQSAAGSGETGRSAPVKPNAAVGSGADVASDAGTGRPQIAHRGGGEIAVSSADGKQVIIMKKATGPDGKGKAVYKLCDVIADKLKCGNWLSDDTPCTICPAEPCPCIDKTCTSVCKAE